MATGRSNRPWDILGISPTRDPDLIRQAYLRQARRHHPDLFGRDPVRFQAQEERMRLINLAYQSALRSAEPKFAKENPEPPPQNHCIEHGLAASGHCLNCGKAICARCPGIRSRLCNRHVSQIVLAHYRRRVIREWVPFLGVSIGSVAVGLSPGWSLTCVATFTFGLGLFRIRFSGWRGLLYFWIFPFGLMASGLYSLYEGLDHLSRAAQDESLWRQFFSQAGRV